MQIGDGILSQTNILHIIADERIKIARIESKNEDERIR